MAQRSFSEHLDTGLQYPPFIPNNSHRRALRGILKHLLQVFPLACTFIRSRSGSGGSLTQRSPQPEARRALTTGRYVISCDAPRLANNCCSDIRVCVATCCTSVRRKMVFVTLITYSARRERNAALVV